MFISILLSSFLFGWAVCQQAPVPANRFFNNAYNPIVNPYNPATNPYNPVTNSYNPVSSPFNPLTPYRPGTPYNTPFVPILDYSNELNVDGSYRYSFVTADGKQAEESGYLKDVSINNNGEPIGIQVVQGSYSYTAPDGTPVQVSYIADENGFQPTSIRIPSTGGVALPNTPFNRVNPYNPQLRNAYANNPFSIPRYNTPFINNPNTNGNVNNQNKNN